MRIRAASPDDAAAIAEIYAPYVRGSAVSFESEPPGPDEVGARMASGEGLYPWLVAVDESGAPAGYAYATPFRRRHAYRFVVETSVYLGPEAKGRGLGTLLYQPLLEILEAQGFTQALAAIALPNEPSVRLHERLGFGPAGSYARVGYKLGAWWDVGLWQKPLAPAGDTPREPGLPDLTRLE